MASSAAAETNGISSQQHDEEKGIHRTQTAVTMSPELFEKVRRDYFMALRSMSAAR